MCRDHGQPVTVSTRRLSAAGKAPPVPLLKREEAMIRIQALCVAAAAATLFAGTALAGRVATGPCGSASPSTAHYTHVIWILEENHSYGKIVGSSHAPYINHLAHQCGLATNYHNISHPSLPNYVGMTSGLGFAQLRKFSSDCSPSKRCSTSAPSILGETSSWKAYEESMPSNCHQKDHGEYAVRHNPGPYFTRLANCKADDVPYTKLSGDLSGGKLPAFAFITPNLIDDMHDGTVAQGDSWLKEHLPRILNSTEYRFGSTVVFITWDEGEGGSSNRCATNTIDVSCHVATIVISPTTTPGTKSGTLFNHYSLLRTTEQLLGLPLLGLAQGANGMQSAFGL
jgi:phospholipase C